MKETFNPLIIKERTVHVHERKKRNTWGKKKRTIYLVDKIGDFARLSEEKWVITA